MTGLLSDGVPMEEMQQTEHLLVYLHFVSCTRISCDSMGLQVADEMFTLTWYSELMFSLRQILFCVLEPWANGVCLGRGPDGGTSTGAVNNARLDFVSCAVGDHRCKTNLNPR